MTSRPVSKSLSPSETLEDPGRLPATARPACGPRRFFLRVFGLPRLLHAPTRAHHEVMVIAPGHHHLQCLLITKIKVSEELLEEHGTEPSVR
jgi:hypothetical protein